MLAFPGLLAVVMIVAIVRVLTARHPQPAAIAVCVVIVILDVVLAWYLSSTGSATFAVTHEDITFTPRQGRGHQGARPQVISRTPGSTLSFHLKDGGTVRPRQGPASLRVPGRDLLLTRLRQPLTSGG